MLSRCRAGTPIFTHNSTDMKAIERIINAIMNLTAIVFVAAIVVCVFYFAYIVFHVALLKKLP